MRTRDLIVGILLILLVVLFGFNYFKSPTLQQVVPTPSPTTLSTPMATSSAVLGIRTKTTGCIVQGALPDKDCTPGAIISNVTKDQVCTPGYAKSVRNVPEKEKEEVFTEYNITSHVEGEYEVDHLISLELGGDNSISNLWPEAAEPKPGFHEKDILENQLHKKVCDGQISLEQAQMEISTDWLKVYQSSSN